jgi:stage III sporulation protein AA
LARQFSSGTARLKVGFKVGIIDERSELAACYKGVPQYDVGPRTDVLDACPKVEGMMMMIRSMSPDVLMVDEIGRPEDSAAIFEALNSGVSVVTTAHGKDLADVSKRPSIRRLIQEEVFDRYIVLSKKQGVGTVEGIFDQALKRMVAGRSATC